MNSFSPLGRGIVVPFVCRRPRRSLRRRQNKQSFDYYTNMVRQIEFIIHTNIQPLQAPFYTQVKVKGQGQRLKKLLLTRSIEI